MSIFNFQSNNQANDDDDFIMQVPIKQRGGDILLRPAARMTYRSPSSASTSSRSSASSAFSSASSNTSDHSSLSSHECWNQSISVREIYKTGKLRLLAEKKGLLFRKPTHKFEEDSVWCVFCIHEETSPFLEIYADHQSSLSHQPLRVIPLISCQHVTPNISPLLHSNLHSFTLTLTANTHQLAADTDHEMRDWLNTLRAKIGDLQNLHQHNNHDSKHEYTRCPLAATSHTTADQPAQHSSPSPSTTPSLPGPHLVLSVPPKLPALPVPAPRIQRRPPPPLIKAPANKTHETPLSSPPACLAPAPPVPPRKMQQMMHPLTANCQIPPPPPPRLTGKPPKSKSTKTDNSLLIDLGQDLENVYGTLFVTPRRSDTTLAEFRRETRSATASPTFSEKSSCSTVSEPTSPSSHRSNLLLTSATTSQVGVPVISQTTTTLRQQQVERLRQEMRDPHGVQVRIRRLHCVDGLALVDVFNAVWIAGWKQHEHPYLQSMLHVGDQVQSVNGICVHKASDVHKILKETLANKYLLFGLQRLPHGKALVMSREFDGQELGLTRDGNGGEICGVQPNGLAAASGLPTKALTCDGSNLCNWMLTEINHRPLNLFFKDNEIEDRLKAVGKEISILVQPADFVVALKKQLRTTIKNYRDFTVQ